MLKQTTLIIAGLMGLLLLAACSRFANSDESHIPQKAIPVRIVEVQLTTDPIPVTTSGRLSSDTEMLLSFKIGGIVEGIMVDEGQSVKAGQLLAQLNQVEINARVSQAQNAFDKTTRDLSRVENLYRDSVVTLEQLQDARTGKELAMAELKVAQFNHRYARIIAPVNGRVLKRFGEAGELVNPGMPVLQIGTSGNSTFILRVGVTDQDVVRLAIGDTAHVYFDAYKGKRFAAVVSQIAAAADYHTGVFEVELTLAPGSLLLKNGFIGKVTLYPSNQPHYYRIPMGALVEGHQDLVHILIPNSSHSAAKKLSLRPDFVGKDYFTVLFREAGELNEVITEGSAYLRDGEAIVIISHSPTSRELAKTQASRQGE